MEAALQDIRYAFRGFHRNPVFAISILLTLALGIGTTTAVFSVVDRVLFRPLPYADAGRLVSVGLVQSLEHQEFLMGRSFVKWRDSQKPFYCYRGPEHRRPQLRPDRKQPGGTRVRFVSGGTPALVGDRSYPWPKLLAGRR